MANGPFDRTIINPREKPLSSDINQAESQLDRTLRFFAEILFSDKDTGAINDGFINKSLNVEVASPVGLSVVVRRGLGYQTDAAAAAAAIGGIVGLDDLSDYKPLPLLSNATFAVPTAPTAPDSRIDIIEVKASVLSTNPSTRQILNTGTGAFEPLVVNKILTWLLDNRVATVLAPANSTQPLSYKQGVAANPGVVPATTTGYIKLCEIAVGSDVTQIVAADITDTRPIIVATDRIIKEKFLSADGEAGAFPTATGGWFGRAGTAEWDGTGVGAVIELNWTNVLDTGQRIRGIRIHGNNTPVADVTIRHQDRTEGGVPFTNLLTDDFTSALATGFDLILTMNLATPFEPSDPENWVNVSVVPSNTGTRISGLWIIYDEQV